MSKPRYDWWQHVKGMARRYKTLEAKYKGLHSMSITTNLTGMPHGSGEQRTLENVAIKELPTNEQREYESVRWAVERIKRQKNSLDKLKVIQLVYWDKTHTLEGAAQQIPVSYDTAKSYNREFLRLIAAAYGYLD